MRPTVKFQELNMVMEGTDALYHEAARRLGVSDAEMSILYMLYENGDGFSQKKLYQQTGISKTTINSSVKKMESEGYIKLIKSSNDARNTEIFTTPKGKELLDRTAAKIVRIENDIYDSWTKEEIQMVIALNRKYMEDFAERIKDLGKKDETDN